MGPSMSKLEEITNDKYPFQCQTPGSNADREIPTLGSTDNAGNSVNLGLEFLCLHRRPMIDSICPTEIHPHGPLHTV